jgi:hypothetical protein
MGQIFSSGGSNRHHQRTTTRPTWSRPWITFRRFISRTARRIKCFVKSTTDPVRAWFQEQLDDVVSRAEPLLSPLRTAARETLRFLTLVTRPLIAAVWWIARTCYAIVHWITTSCFSVICCIFSVCWAIFCFIFSILVIVAIIKLLLITPLPVLIAIFWFWVGCVVFVVVSAILVVFFTQIFRAIRYLASHAFDCLNGTNGVGWWPTLFGRIGCIAAILASFLGPELLVIPGGALILVILYAAAPLVTLFFDTNLIPIPNCPTLNYIVVQLQKAFKEVYDRLGTGFRGFFRGLIPSRLAPIISFFIAASLLGPTAITIPQVVSVVLGIVFALRRDPVIGPYMDEFFAWVGETVDPILEWILECFGLSRSQVDEWLLFFHSSLMRIFSTVIIAIPLQSVLQQTLQQLPGGWFSWIAIAITIVAALVMMYKRRRQFRHDNWLRRVEASQPFDQARGVPVYSSQRATFGSINHQVLFVNHRDVGPYKYELRMPRNDGQAQAEYTCSPITAQQARRKVPLRDSGDNFYVYLVGWTTLSHTQIDEFCDSLMPWDYSSVTHNCQHFIREVGRHIVTTQAIDWDFFDCGAETDFQAYLFSQWRITWPIWTLDKILMFWMPPYFFVRQALY